MELLAKPTEAWSIPRVDEETRSRLESALRSSRYGALAKLSVEVSQGCARLSGQVSSYYLKQVAQETVLRLATVDQLDNRVRVAAS